MDRQKDILGNDMKRCSKCKQYLPATLEFFTKDRTHNDGFRSSCKECSGSKFKKPKPIPRKGFKFCWDCKNELPASKENFHKNKEIADGLSGICKKCKSKRAKKYEETNKERIAKQNRKYYWENREVILSKCKIYREENKEKFRKKGQKYYINNKEMISARAKEHYLKNKEYIIEKSKEFYQNNKDHRRKYLNDYKKKRRKTDIGFHISEKISAGIRNSIRKEKNGYSWEDLVGYSLTQLINRLKRTMPDGYSWDNVMNGNLHIDHIIPISAFDYSTPYDEDFLRCWALSNLRLLPAEENMSKGAKILKPFQRSLPLSLGGMI